ncbi:hypothetical protein CXF77_12370 [Planococcus sp. MB-3u-09]|uniref:hypothetical protein n=2 Tax=unclassified Planococcus (in: firmicutes) TaxID=2662419 RepID=UPI000C7D4361|nr:hypothetical protein [Planococcus sp. Urea-3u-39]PKG88406.1 hypothetical protein CXF91_10450 [Planococcus sp. Urea-3u-39]PKH38876.1 hypothetical protein CXF77_12370 [Planococcus sp. MB-3u-09]
MSKIKFYSEYSFGMMEDLEKIAEKINNEDIDAKWDINDLLEFHNILKYIKVESFREYIIQETKIDIKKYEEKIKRKIGIFLSNHNDDFLHLFHNIDFDNSDDFFEVFEDYKVYKSIKAECLQQFFEKENVHIYAFLKSKRLTNFFDEVVRSVLISDPSNAEIVLSKYLKENELFMPPSLTESDILILIQEYIVSPQVNTNVLRKIITFPPNKGMKIPDKIKLYAKRKVNEEEERVFANETGIESRIMISYLGDQEEEVSFRTEGRNISIKVSKKWIEENTDYPTLWNNFIYLFGFVDETMRLFLDSRKSESSALESLFIPQAAHLYYKSSTFDTKEMVSNIQIQSYAQVLRSFGVNLEEMIEWFFDIYMKEEFQIDDFIVKMPSTDASYFEKCRTILPEIDRIFKQYNTLVEDGVIDHDLIQMSSSSFKTKEIISFNRKKYVYSTSNWFKTVSNLLFSDQSGIFRLPNRSKKHSNFFNLINAEKLSKSEFHEHQLRKLQWLFDNDLIFESFSGHIEFVDWKTIYILKELYDSEVMSYWHYPHEIQVLIEELESRNLVDIETSLFSRNEQDYIDYYLNKSKFTNGHDIRNKYLHGTNTNDEREYEIDYYMILKLFVIIVLKINDDLCVRGGKQ